MPAAEFPGEQFVGALAFARLEATEKNEQKPKAIAAG